MRIDGSLLFVFLAASLTTNTAAQNKLVEAESFKNPGGWQLDTQFIQTMGSPYLLAHGCRKYSRLESVYGGSEYQCHA